MSCFCFSFSFVTSPSLSLSLFHPPPQTSLSVLIPSRPYTFTYNSTISNVEPRKYSTVAISWISQISIRHVVVSPFVSKKERRGLRGFGREKGKRAAEVVQYRRNRHRWRALTQYTPTPLVVAQQTLHLSLQAGAVSSCHTNSIKKRLYLYKSCDLVQSFNSVNVVTY